ncbi:peptidoglycan DD-metalloendopeptidase family protein [Polymorphospora rubra]|uniref:peptidoglycan DD-metalloendopeptidase family protein n=1 Tax=Polymorphospora rubra TaxID=338584 RepID=UPI001BB2F955|nr:peptidoglycan DD-metalloendopeptidase family protein [Polymorphospora rubra]
MRTPIASFVVIVLVAGIPVPVHAATPADLAAAVAAHLRDGPLRTEQWHAEQRQGGPARSVAAPDPDVVVAARSTDEHGFGSVVVRAPEAAGAYPTGWLFVARREAGAWRVAVEGEPTFAELSAGSEILHEEERRVLAGAGGRSEAGPLSTNPSDRRTGMRLPWATGQSWRYTGGPHPMSGGVRSSVDFAGGDGRVLAVRGGLAYTMCGSGRGWIRVVHDRGLATDYYHLQGNISADGKAVKEGDFLGNIGNDVSCGGSSTGAHVHFSLRRNNAYVPIDRYNFGKWVISASGADYSGSAWHGSRRVGVGGTLHNHGVLGFTQGVVDTDGGTVLNRRSGPGAGHPVVGTVLDGTTVTVECSARGTRHVGRSGYSSDLWNKLTDGSWVSDVFLWTGTGDPVNGLCP